VTEFAQPILRNLLRGAVVCSEGTWYRHSLQFVLFCCEILQAPSPKMHLGKHCV
jgi:hypothetical protein